MAIPKYIVITDLHIKESNIDQTKDLIQQVITLAKHRNINTVIGLGDFFNSRKAQTESVLNAFGFILDMFKDNDITLYAIAGNHDKTDYDDIDSFLTPFKNHPNFVLFEEFGVHDFNDFKGVFLPYYSESVYLHYLTQLNVKNKAKMVLFTHQGVEGVKNNDGTKVDNDIKQSLFKNFDLTLVGHYHDRSNLPNNIHYIGSLSQNNFGENDEKGCCILYDDLSVEYVDLVFRRYVKVIIDKPLSKPQLTNLISQVNVQEENVRFEFISTTEDKALIDIDFIKKLGIDVKIKRKDIESAIELAEEGESIQFNNSSIMEEFEKFCEHENVQFYEFGKEILNKILKNG